MRIALLIYKYFPYGGLQRDFLRFAQQLRERGHTCRVYALSWEGEALRGVDLRIVPVRALRNHRRNILYQRWVQNDLVRDPVDGVVGFNRMPGLDVYFAGDPCYLDIALTERSALYRRGARFAHFTQWERAVFAPPSQTQVLMISESEQSKFVKHYGIPGERMHLLPPGVAQNRRAPPETLQRRRNMREQLDFDPRDLTLLFVAASFKTKGLDRVIAAVAHMRQVQPNAEYRLLVVGSDKTRRYVKLAKRLGVPDAVRFLGPREDILDLMLASDVLVHPALSEAGGVVLLEALAAGLPVVASSVCGYVSHVIAAGAGIVLRSPFSQRDLNEALVRCVNKDYRAQLGHRALQYAQSTDLYSMHDFGTELMLELLQRKSHSAGHSNPCKPDTSAERRGG